MPVETEVRGRVLVVTMQREAKRNAIDQELADGIGAALDRLDDDPDLWVGVLTGNRDGLLRRHRPGVVPRTGARPPTGVASTA